MGPSATREGVHVTHTSARADPHVHTPAQTGLLMCLHGSSDLTRAHTACAPPSFALFMLHDFPTGHRGPLRGPLRVGRPHYGGAAGSLSLTLISWPHAAQRSAQELPLVEKQSAASCPVLGGKKMVLSGHNFLQDSKVIFVEKAPGMVFVVRPAVRFLFGAQVGPGSWRQSVARPSCAGCGAAVGADMCLRVWGPSLHMPVLVQGLRLWGRHHRRHAHSGRVVGSALPPPLAVWPPSSGASASSHPGAPMQAASGKHTHRLHRPVSFLRTTDFPARQASRQSFHSSRVEPPRHRDLYTPALHPSGPILGTQASKQAQGRSGPRVYGQISVCADLSVCM